MNITQIRSTDDTGTLSYLVSDDSTAFLIDPNVEDVSRIGKIIREKRVQLTHIIDTHTHADHVSGAAELQQQFGAKIVMHENTKNKWKVVNQGDKFGIGDILRANAKIPIDVYVNDDDELTVGTLNPRILFTPGHTDNHISVLIEDAVFTGDLLLIGQAGRSDLPGGNTEDQYDSLMTKIMTLPDATKIYPGHDYEGNEFAVLAHEKQTNPFLKRRTIAEYVQFVQDFFPPIADAVEGGKVILQCGAQRVAQAGDTFKNISANELREMLGNGSRPALLDVREPLELMMMGAIEGVQNISVRQLMMREQELPRDKSKPVVAICASGNRSVEAAHVLQQLGYTNVLNLVGGTGGWIRSGFPVERRTVSI